VSGGTVISAKILHSIMENSHELDGWASAFYGVSFKKTAVQSRSYLNSSSNERLKKELLTILLQVYMGAE
jgi:hypothetical protein